MNSYDSSYRFHVQFPSLTDLAASYSTDSRSPINQAFATTGAALGTAMHELTVTYGTGSAVGTMGYV